MTPVPPIVHSLCVLANGYLEGRRPSSFRADIPIPLLPLSLGPAFASLGWMRWQTGAPWLDLPNNTLHLTVLGEAEANSCASDWDT
jgi:hypothetical protein